jgi:DNA repair protein RAD5
MYNTHPDTKAVIFSQWTSMLDLVEVVLNENAFNFFRLDGTMSQKKREETLRKFKTQKNTKLLLASLRSTGVGLNLTEASYVFMMDPWWNESVENQAIDRVHRLGQTHPVTVKRFIIKGSVEEKMLAIQKKKSALAGAITGHGEQTVTLEDLMGLFV